MNESRDRREELRISKNWWQDYKTMQENSVELWINVHIYSWKFRNVFKFSSFANEEIIMHIRKYLE